jgi:hypothetical protein
MKTKYMFLSILILVACQRMESEQPVFIEENAERADSVWIFSIEAVKDDAQTKALDLVNEGTRLNAYWKSTETVAMYKDGTLLGSLSVTPGTGEKPTTATMSGSITASGLAENDALTLLFPRTDWDYTGQTGSLTGTNSIEEKYAYVTATVIIKSITGANVSTTEASFANEESIYRFSFRNGDSALAIKDFTLSAANGRLVQSRAYSGGWTSAYGPIDVTPASATSDPLYVSLRNESTATDSYSFVITGADDILYLASKTIPDIVLDAPGRFISAQNITATKASFDPHPSGEVNDPEEIL